MPSEFEHDIDQLLPSIKLIDFPKITTDLRTRVAVIECPTCLNIGNFYSMEKNMPFAVIACKGSLPPEHEHQDMLGNRHKHQVVCAGINVPHFHVQCRCCDFVFFIALPNKENSIWAK